MVKNINPKTVNEWYAFHGGEESGINMELASRIWDAAIKSVIKNNKKTCKWKYNDDDDFYNTSCGEAWVFPEGRPQENGLKFCPVCGKKVVYKKKEE